MSADHPVTELMNEHRLIERVLSALEARLNEEPASGFPAAFVGQALEFFAEFADGCHHFKEEESLFPALARAGMPVEGGPIGMMLYEHDIGRRCLSGIRQQLDPAREGDAAACASIRAYAKQYIELLRSHIWKEDNILFQKARHALDEKTAAQVLEQFHAGGGTKTSAEVVARAAAFAASI
jgi:hemerythrin-like domain-containing protein